MTSPKEVRRRLAEHGVEGWADPAKSGTPKFKWIPLAKMETSHAACMLEFRDNSTEKEMREQGIWPKERVYPKAPTTYADFLRLRKR